MQAYHNLKYNLHTRTSEFKTKTTAQTYQNLKQKLQDKHITI